MTCNNDFLTRGARRFTYALDDNCTFLPLNGNDVVYSFTIAAGADIAADPTTPTPINLGAAIPTGVYMVAGSKFTARDPDRGATVLLEVASAVTAGDTVINVKGVPELIADGSTIQYPPIFDRQEGINFEMSTNLITSDYLEDDGWSRQTAGSFTASSSANGGFNQLSPVAQMLMDQAATRPFAGMAQIIQLLTPKGSYATGTIIHHQFEINTLPLAGTAADRLTLNATLQNTGRPQIIHPQAA